MVGVVWGIWKGFAIVAAGTLLGEIANWFVFKNFCSRRAKLYEAKKLAYACLARVVREGGFWVRFRTGWIVELSWLIYSTGCLSNRSY